MSPRESTVLERTYIALRRLSDDKSRSFFFKTEGNGHPDLVGSVNGTAVVCEVKQPGKKPKPLQYARLVQWARTGALALWTDGDKWYRIGIYKQIQEDGTDWGEFEQEYESLRSYVRR